VLIRSIAKILEVDSAELILLAEKIPSETREVIARSPSARKLLRRAENLSEAEWKELLRRIPPTRHEALVDATDLELWSVRRDAQALLPLLIRNLVLATADGPCAVAFRTGEGVALPGWDGTVTSKIETNFLPTVIPDGSSARRHPSRPRQLMTIVVARRIRLDFRRRR